MISVPYADKRDENARRFPGPKGAWPCLLCGRGVVLEKARWVRVHGGGSLIVTREEAAQLNTHPVHQGGDMEGQPIGPDCWRRHPELHPYEGQA